MPRAKTDTRIAAGFVDTKTAALRLGKSESRIRQMVGEGVLRADRFGGGGPTSGNLMIREDSIEAYLAHPPQRQTPDVKRVPAPYLTRREAAKRLGMTYERLRQYIAAGQLKTKAFGRHDGIHPRTLDAFKATIRPAGRPATVRPSQRRARAAGESASPFVDSEIRTVGTIHLPRGEFVPAARR